MNKEFIPYQQALALVLLGYTEYSELYKDDKEELFDMRIPNDAPCILYQQAFRWFREKYNAYIVPEKFDETKWWVNWGTWTTKVFDTFEEAELECLKKLIQIAKEKK